MVQCSLGCSQTWSDTVVIRDKASFQDGIDIEDDKDDLTGLRQRHAVMLELMGMQQVDRGELA